MKKTRSLFWLLGFLVFFSGLNGNMPAQEIAIKIVPDRNSIVAGGDDPLPVFRISTKPRCLVCIELATNNKVFAGVDRVTGMNFFSSLFGDVEVKGEEIYTDDAGKAEYALPVALWGFWNEMKTGGKIYYRALAIDAENSDLAGKNVAVLGSTLGDEDWQEAPSIEVFATAEEKNESDRLGEARVPWKRGLELYRGGSYDEAILEFNKAKEIVSRGHIDYSISLCHLQLALAHAEKALRHPTSSDQAKEYSKAIIEAINGLISNKDEK